MARDEDRAELGDLIATPMRERGIREGRRYWRIRDRDRRTVVTGWWTRDELDGAIAVALTSPRKTVRARSAAGATVGDLLGLWRAAQVTRQAAGEIAERTLDIYRNSVRSWLATDLASMLATRLSRAVVTDQATAWRAAGVAPRTVDLQIRVFRAAVAWGADRGHCPAVDLAIPASARDDEHVYGGRVPTRADLVAVLAVVAPGPRRDAIEILGLTGARAGEVAALRVADVDLVARTIRLSGRDEERGRRGKTTARLFPLRGRLLGLVAELVEGKAPTDRLLDLPRHAVQVVSTELSRACVAAGVGSVTPHGIRRLVVAELLEAANGNAKRVSRLTGHSVTVLLRSYVRPTPDELASLVEVAQLGVLEVDNVRPMRRGTRSGHTDD